MDCKTSTPLATTMNSSIVFEHKMPCLVAEREAQVAESARLELAIRENLSQISFALSAPPEVKM